MKFSSKLFHWYQKNKRDLPWRKTKDPYKIWISEVILQQTRVNQGLPYYTKFIKKYSCLNKLSLASEEEVLLLWQGLGYYKRAINLLESAKIIVKKNNGVFPNTFDEILKIKGVGDYTASAISSICYSEKEAVVDGNVFRFISRLFGIKRNIKLKSTFIFFKEKLKSLIENVNPGDFNQALMEFGALQCLPINPLCDSCIFKLECKAYIMRDIKSYPLKKIKVIKKKRYFNYIVISTNKKIIFKKRRGDDIWKNLYEFPLIEGNHSKLEQLANKKKFIILTKKLKTPLKFIKLVTAKHLLSHQILNIKFWLFFSEESFKNLVSLEEIINFPKPVVISDFINKHLKS
tara:strand:+ start:410 stop:1447 length:1038 start_codon:yes stop_codon:yes gene_type:complete